MSKNKYDEFNLPPTGPNLCDFYGQYIGFGGGNGGASGVSVTSIAKSALYISGNNENLTRTPDSASNRDIWTFSTWVFRTLKNAEEIIFNAGADDNNRTTIKFNANNIQYFHFDGGGVTDVLTTNAVMRDLGWLHLVVAVDTTEAIEINRVIIYVNGVRITSYSTANYPAQNADTDFNSGEVHTIGCDISGSNDLDAYLAETVLIDGAQLAPTSFGQYDSSGLYWTPLSSATIKELTFGTNGFYLDNASNAQTDASGNGHNFTNNNTVTTSTHTPTNVYATLNPLMAGSPGAFTQGNRTATIPPVNSSVISSLPMPATGKWYCEFSFATIHGYAVVGVSQMNASTWLENSAQYTSPSTPIFTEEGTLFTKGTQSGDSITVATDTIYGLMWDADNSILKLTDGTDTFQCAYTVNDIGIVGSVPLGFIFAISSGSVTGVVSVNFGDPPFSISSGNTDGNGQGNFEFAPPTGYLALNTSNLAASTTDTRTASDITKYFEPILYEGNGTAQRVGPLQPFGDSYTVGKGALFIGANSEDLSRGSMSGTANTFTMSMWVKRADPALGGTDANFMFTTASDAGLAFSNNSTADLLSWYSGSYTASTQVFNDASSWMNVVFKSSSGTGTAYVNGVQILGSLTVNGADATMAIGSYNNSSNFFDGYMAEVVLIDGTALEPTSFGKVDTTTGRWIPIDVSGLTFGTNGFYLNFASSGDVGNDVSGNNNDFTNNNTVVQVADTPTSNFNTYDPSESSGVFSTGNTISASGNNSINIGTLPLHSGKWVFEATGTTDSLVNHFVGVAGPLMPTDNGGAQSGFSDGYMLENDDGSLWIDGADSGLDASATWTTDDVIRLEIDRDNHTLQWFKNGSSILSIKNVYDKNWRTATSYATFMATTMNSGASSFAGTPTSGFLAISQDNMASTNQFISAFSWTKNRDAADDYLLMDRVRGINKYLHSDDAAVEVTNVETVQRFLKGGIQVGSDVEINTANESYVSWNWYMEATGSGSSNTDGSINTTSTLVDTTLGLSISTYTGTGSNATVGHGLGAVPRLIFIKNRGVTDSWAVYYGDNTDYLVLDTATGTVDDATMWQDTTPTSTVWSIGTNHQVNADGENYIAYCFANSQFISVGEFLGNENVNGPYVSTVNSLGVPIQPTFVMIKNMSQSRSWNVWDNKRSPFNVSQNLLEWDYVQAEQTGSTYFIDIVTGGFKPRGTHELLNGAEQMLYFAMGSPIIDTSGRIIAGKL